MSFEVSEPIQNSPFEKPSRYWYIQEGEEPQLREGRRPPVIFPPRDQKEEWTETALLRRSKEYPAGYELALVRLIRERTDAWRGQDYPGVTRTTLELLQWWRREGREKRLFFAQLEAAESIIFLTEARADFLQGISIPRDEPSDERKAEGFRGFLRYACKMATGSGKTTVMGMLAAWSILNKVNDRSDGRFSDVVLVVCPNVTIRGRLTELDPERGEASIYRTRDLVSPHLIPLLTQGKVLVTNWHVFEPQGVQTGGVSAKVTKAGVAVRTRETINIGTKTTTARGSRYLTLKDYERQVAAGLLTILEEQRDRDTTSASECSRNKQKRIRELTNLFQNGKACKKVTLLGYCRDLAFFSTAQKAGRASLKKLCLIGLTGLHRLNPICYAGCSGPAESQRRTSGN